MIIAQYNRLADKIRNLSFIKKYPTIKELAKYVLVGNLANVIDLGLYIYLTRAFFFWREHYLIANIFTMFIASIVRFMLHKRWTFRDSSPDVHIQYSKFILIMIVGLLINEAVLFLAVEHLDFYDIIGKVGAMIAGTLIVYYLTRSWVFGKPRNDKTSLN